MHCRKCGKRIPESSGFCPFCGERVRRVSRDDTTSASAGSGTDDAAVRPPSGDGVAPRPAPPAPRRRRRGVAVAVGVGALVLVAAAVAVVLLVRGGVLPTFLPGLGGDPAADDAFRQMVTDDLEGTASQMALDSEWCESEEPEVVSVEITELPPATRASDGGMLREATATVVYEDGTTRTTSEWSVVYRRDDSAGADDGDAADAWAMDDILELSRDVEPMGPVPDEAIVEHGPSLLSLVDEDPPEDENGRELLLGDLYKQDVTFGVQENDTGPDGDGTVEVAVSARNGIVTYEGTLTATIVWNDSGCDWEISSCSADDAAYEQRLDGLVGTWQGKFEETEHNSVMDAAACYGGRNNPPRLVVKSVDNTAGTATVDLSVLVHDHGSLANAAENSEGDDYVTVTDALITLKPDQTYFYQIYETNDYEVSLATADDGSIQMQVYTTAQVTADGHAWRTDTFAMQRVEEEG